jgi:hypothetical protein
LQKVFTVFRADSPQLFVDVNRDQCARMGVEIDEVFQTLQAFLGSRYVNDFNRFRPHLAGGGAVRAAVSAAASRTFAACACATARGGWCPWGQ